MRMSNVQYIKLTFTVISLCGCAFSVVQWPILRIQTITRFFLIIVLFITMAIFTSKQKTSLCQITTAIVLMFISAVVIIHLIYSVLLQIPKRTLQRVPKMRDLFPQDRPESIVSFPME